MNAISSSETVRPPVVLPPMLQQYLAYKEQHPDYLLFFQVGDFYELFDDAVTVSKTLNLTLTSRDKSSANPVPMCGVPLAVVDGYLMRLVEQGFSVALVSQVGSTPSGKGGVERKLERMITPGVQIASPVEVSQSENRVAAIAYQSEQDLAVAYTAVESGIVVVREVSNAVALCAETARIAPTELVLPKVMRGRTLDGRSALVRDLSQSSTAVAIKFRPEPDNALARLRDLTTVSGYNSLGVSGQRAVRALLSYIDEVTLQSSVQVREVHREVQGRSMGIDATTRANLELVLNQRDGSEDGTLLQYLDATQTVGGKRLLRQWILEPLLDVALIRARHEHVGSFLSHVEERRQMREILKNTTDLERIAARTELGIVTPRELGALRDCFLALPAIDGMLQVVDPKRTITQAEPLRSKSIGTLCEMLSRSLVDVPALHLREGNIIREGYNEELDHFRSIRTSGHRWIEQFEQSERQRTGVGSLKVKSNNVFGYFIEVTKANLAKVPADYVRKQTTANGERFTTAVLKEREREVFGAEERQLALERKLFEELRAEVKAYCSDVRRVARVLSHIDCLQSLAQIAEGEALHCPEVDESVDLFLGEARHPVLSKLLTGSFVPNTLALGRGCAESDGAQCAIITGPNMGGKSTYLRQAALIVVMAQLGSYVPAARARIGIVDQVFARIGASDNLREGQSTFMVEMREAALIVSNATERSLVLIDEIGRGTATTDGLALAQAILEWIVVTLRCRTLFATHFHELTQLADHYDGLSNLSVGSVERGSSILFTHHICKGAASKSYGIEVAKLAGLPKELLRRARQVLTLLDSKPEEGKPTDQLSLFARAAEPVEEKSNSEEQCQLLLQELNSIDVNSLTPIQALFELQELKTRLTKALDGHA